MASNPFNALMDPAQVGASWQNAFQAGREQSKQAQTDQAIYDYVSNPSQESASNIARFDPRAGYQVMQQEQQRRAAELKAQEEAQQKAITAAALQGDPGARQQLAYYNTDLYLKLDTQQRQQMDKLYGAIGQMAGQILTLPRERQEPALQQALAHFQQMGVDTSQFQLTGDPEADVKTALAYSGQLDNWEKSQQPSYMAIPQGGTLVNTRDAGAVAQFGQQPPQQQAPQQPNQQVTNILRKATAEQVISPEEAQMVQQQLGPNGQAAFQGWLQQNGVKIGKQVNGQSYYQINGKWYDNPEGR